MRGHPWKDEIAEGRVFELRSASKRFAPPCALIIRAGETWQRAVVEVNRYGAVSYGWRSGHPLIYVERLHGDNLIRRIVRRRPELERFDCFDLDLLRYGCYIDFTGRISSHSGSNRIPSVRTGEWTVFWIPPSDDWWWPREEIKRLMSGAWYVEDHGGARHLGYKYLHMWATRHTGARLNEIRQLLRRKRPDVVEQPVRVVTERHGEVTYTHELRRPCPALGGSRFLRWQHDDGTSGFQCTCDE